MSTVHPIRPSISIGGYRCGYLQGGRRAIAYEGNPYASS